MTPQIGTDTIAPRYPHLHPEALAKRDEAEEAAKSQADAYVSDWIDGDLVDTVLYMDGAIPSDEVDHIDGDPSNNRWVNLRQCSHAENMQNKQVSKANKSGLLGVSKHGNAWQATIRVGKQHHHIGRFRTPEEAHQAYLEAKARIHEFNPKIDNGRASV